ncbi:MAG: hypothetical protein M5U14_00975 [Acidimicrobiia bacterium]|nr:hypothetical protein [Acidimicrobiia bacterium]
MNRFARRAVQGIAAVGVAAGVMLPAAAFAEDVYPTPSSVPDVGEVESGAVQAPAVEAEAVSAEGGGLPVTGGDVIGLVAIGAGAAGVGTVLVRGSRRRTT